MRQESKLTARQEWENFAETVQDDVNEVLNELSETISEANNELATLYTKNPEQAAVSARAVVDMLNNKWEYHSHSFFVSGEWYETVLSEDEDERGFRGSHGRKSAFSRVRSSGFGVKNIEVDGKKVPRIGMLFTNPPVGVTCDSMVVATVTTVSFAEPREVSLQYLRSTSGEILSSNVEEVRTALLWADRVLESMGGHDSMVFYNRGPLERQRIVDEVIAGVEATMPLPDAYDKLLASIETRQLYVKNDPEAEPLILTPGDQRNQFKMRGVVMGVTTVPVRGRDCPQGCQRIHEGVALVVHPYHTNFDTSCSQNGLFFVPLRQAGKAELDLKAS